VIIDNHAHILPAHDSLADWDFTNREEQSRHAQRLLYVMRSRAVRCMSDDAVAPDAWRGLWAENRAGQWEGCQEVGFRYEDGKYIWEENGISYYVPAWEAAPPEKLIALMDVVGIDQAVIQTPRNINRYLACAARKYPGRLLPLAAVEESSASASVGVDALHSRIEDLGLRGLYFDPLPGWEGFENFHTEKYAVFWREVAALHIPVYFGGNFKPWHFAEMLPRVREWVVRFPHIVRVLVHGFPPELFLTDDGLVRVPDVVRDIMLDYDFYVEVLPLAHRHYRHPRALEVIRALYDEFGPERLLWGSEFIKGGAPHTPANYAVRLHFLEVHCSFMSQRDLALILGENARRIFGAAGCRNCR